MTAATTWSTVGDIRAKVRSRWDDGSLLRAYAAGAPFPRIEVPLRGPRAAEIGDRLDDVRTWKATLDAGRHGDSRYSLDHTEVGGRLIGRNQLPSRAIVASYAQAWDLLGTRAEVARFDEARSMTAGEPTALAWVDRHPLPAIRLHAEWPALVAAYRWLDDHRGSGRYLREISAPGVDTKFAEGHRDVLGQLLEVPGSAPAFLKGLGLRARPELTRLRPDPGLGLLGAASELAVRHDELPHLDVRVTTAVVVENEVTYLSVPVPRDGVVLWGKGFDVDRAGALPWLRDADVHYWGDLDTHGFAILHRLRAWLPDVRSFLMDRDTLVAHRDRWGSEKSPTAARLDRLTPTETALYTDLVEDRLGPRIRLEQERIDWGWARERFPYS
jgi:hypothetical protein